MQIARILRDLWRLRLFVAIVGMVAVLVATAVTHHIAFPGKLESRRHHVGVATARMLVDTPSSQVVAVAPKGSDTLGVRANLIASLMVDGVFKAAIARRAGLPPDRLVGISENDVAESQSAGPPEPGASTLTTRVIPDLDGNQLPIIEIQTQAPDAASAARLADAAVAGLSDYLDSQAAEEQVPAARRLRVSGLGPAQASEVTRGPSMVIGIGVAIFVLVTGCAVVLGVATLVQGWRVNALAEDWSLEGPDDDLVPVPADSDALAEAMEPAAAGRTRTEMSRSIAAGEGRAGSL